MASCQTPTNDCNMGITGRIICSLQDVNLSAVLRSGQAFRWVELPSDEWVSPLGRRLWILHQDEGGIDYKILSARGSETDEHQEKAKAFIEDYFQLKVNLPSLYKAWSAADETFRSVSTELPGVRVLRQDPVENLFCFICSSNNNILRITSMVEKLCARYGEPITEYGGRMFHAFPSLSTLAGDGVESELRQLGFGYRAPFISKAARQLVERGGERWLHDLRKIEYSDCRAELKQLSGVGPKVADCVCLMSLDKAGAVPVDTHVLKLSAQHYLPDLRSIKTLTESASSMVAALFREKFGDRAGWAQAVLFCGDLKEFKESSIDERPVKLQRVADKSAKADKKPASRSDAESATNLVKLRRNAPRPKKLSGMR